MDVLSVTGSRTRSCLLSTVGALMASWATLSRYLYAHQTDCASSKRSLRDLKYLWTLSFAPPRKAIQVRRRCNECTNQSPFLSPRSFWCTLPFAFRLSVVVSAIYFSLVLDDSCVHACRRTFFVFWFARFPSPTMQTSRLRPIYISISWLVSRR